MKPGCYLSKLLVISAALYGAQPSHASPAEAHLASAHEVLERIDTVRTTDFGRRVGKTALANLITEPFIRAMWAGQILTDSDWIGMQALVATSFRLDPGGADNGSNMFVYTCKGGWIDMGHLVASALAYKAAYQGLKGNPVINAAMKLTLGQAGSKFYAKVLKNISSIYKEVSQAKSDHPFNNPRLYALIRESAQLRVDNYVQLSGKNPTPRELKNRVDHETEITADKLNRHLAKGADLDDLYYGFWAGYFGMQLGYAVEYDQHAAKVSEDQTQWTGHHTSAWTLEDLPSDYYGVLVGASLQRKSFVGSVVRQFKVEVNDLFLQLGAVNLDNVVEAEGCKETARDVLGQDTKFYNHLADTERVSHRPGDSVSPISPYNYTPIAKKTKSHDCVCDENNNPINPSPTTKIEEQDPKKKKRIRMGHPGRRIGR